MAFEKEKSAVTLDSAFKAIKHWRDHKDQYATKGIPDTVWEMVFQLEKKGYSGKELRRFLSINSQQYELKRTQFCGDKDSTVAKSESVSDTSTQSSAFCEVNVKPGDASNVPALTEAAKKTKEAVAKLKSKVNNPQDYLDLTTIIVEYTRPDGHRLTIHTTNESIGKVMAAFAKQGDQSND